MKIFFFQILYIIYQAQTSVPYMTLFGPLKKSIKKFEKKEGFKFLIRINAFDLVIYICFRV